MSANLTTLNKCHAQLGISTSKLVALAPASSAANVPTATASVAGTVLKATTVADVASAIPAAAPAGGTGTAAGGWDTAGNRDAAITTINGLRTAVSEIKTQLNALMAASRTAGQLTP